MIEVLEIDADDADLRVFGDPGDHLVDRPGDRPRVLEQVVGIETRPVRGGQSAARGPVAAATFRT